MNIFSLIASLVVLIHPDRSGVEVQSSFVPMEAAVENTQGPFSRCSVDFDRITSADGELCFSFSERFLSADEDAI